MTVKKHPEPTKRETVILIKVKSCNALLRMLLVCIRGYLKSDLRSKFLILATYELGTPYIYVSKDMKIHEYFFEDKRDSRAKTFGNRCFR
jgi:hypothetical protein